MSHTNVAAYLPDLAESLPDGLAVAVAKGNTYQELTFKELNARCDKIAHGLRSVGFEKGMRTVLMVTPSPEFYALTFALFKLQVVPVLVDPGMGIKNLKKCLAEAQPDAFIGVTKAHVARVVLGWAKDTTKILVTVGTRLFWGGHSLAKLEANAPDEPFPMPTTEASEMAGVLFTSGSTGVPKGVVYEYGTFAAQVDMLKKEYGIAPGERDLSTFPLFALFGPALGMASIVPDMDASKPGKADPAKLVKAVQDYKCTNVFANPALVNKLGRYAETSGAKMPSVERVISAGAPAVPASLKRFAKLLNDGVEIFTPYGATESLPIASVGSSTVLNETFAMTEQGKGVCVGYPVEGMEVAIIGISEEAIPTWSDDLKLPKGEIGEIVVKGPVVTKKYWAREESTRLAKIQDGDAVRHRMGDIGYIDDTGRLWMCGRKSHRVVLENGPMFTVPCEAIFNQHPLVFRSALVGIQRGAKTVPVICIEREKHPGVDTKPPSDEVLKKELLALGGEYELTKGIEHVLFHPSFPVDVRHNAKIFREKLTVWAQEKLG